MLIYNCNPLAVLLLAQLDVGLDSFCLEIHKIDLFGALHIAELQNK